MKGSRAGEEEEKVLGSKGAAAPGKCWDALARLLRKKTVDKISQAANGKQTIEEAQKLCPDLIVLDLSVPVMNGSDAAHVLKRLMPTVLLIIYSALGDKSAEHQARLIAISEVVSKSVNASVLIDKA